MLLLLMTKKIMQLILSYQIPLPVGIMAGVSGGDRLLLLSLLLIVFSLSLVVEERVAAEVIIVLESKKLSNNKGRTQPNGSLILPTLTQLISASSLPSPLLLEAYFNNMGTTRISGSNE